MTKWQNELKEEIKKENWQYMSPEVFKEFCNKGEGLIFSTDIPKIVYVALNEFADKIKADVEDYVSAGDVRMLVDEKLKEM